MHNHDNKIKSILERIKLEKIKTDFGIGVRYLESEFGRINNLSARSVTLSISSSHMTEARKDGQSKVTRGLPPS